MELIDLRKEINDVDREIVELLEKRFNIVMKVGMFKKENNLLIYDSSRENTVINNCKGYLKNKKFESNIENIYKEIINNSKDIQNNELLA